MVSSSFPFPQQHPDLTNSAFDRYTSNPREPHPSNVSKAIEIHDDDEEAASIEVVL